MAQTPISSTPSTTAQTGNSTNEAQALNGVEPGNAANATVAANLVHTGTAIASADAPAQVRGVDMGMIQDTAPNINPAALDASAKIQAREAQVQANPALINASAKTGAIGYTAMNFGRVENLNKPTAGKTVTVHADAGEQFKVNFDPNAAQLSVRHGDLIFTFNDGSRIVVDHFVMAGNQMPSLSLPDGTILAGGVVVAQLTGHNADDLFNIETAAGPTAGAVAGAGSFSYSDDLGDVIGLLDKLPPIPFTALVFPSPSDQVVPFAFDFRPGIQPNYEGNVDETNGFAGNTQNGQIIPNFGQDGPGAISLSPNFSYNGSALDSDGDGKGDLTSNGDAVTTSLSGNTVTGINSVTGAVVFTLTVNPNGTYTFELKGPLDHADPANPNDIINLNFTYVVTDRTGDQATGSIVIHVADDAPIANDDTHTTLLNNDTIVGNVITGAGNIDSTGADDLSNDDVDNTDPIQNVVLAVQNSNGTVVSFIDADGNLSPDVKTDANGNEYIQIQGQYGVLNMYADGQYTYAHTTGTGLLQEKFQYLLVDGDGDADPATLTINIDDSIPVVNNQGELQGDRAIDESFNIGQAISGTIIFTASTNSPATTLSLGDSAHNAQFSVDGSVASGPTLHSNGQDVHVILVNGTYVGYTGNDPNAAGAKVFDLVLNNSTTGAYTFTQYQNLDHANASDPNDVITLKFAVTATDADGDQATGTLSVAVKDDAPDAIDDTNHAVREVREYDFSANAANFPALQETANLPNSQPDLYNLGVAKASNVVIDMPTTVSVDRIVSDGFVSSFQSPLFAFTQAADGSLTNIKLLFGIASGNSYDPGPTHADYTMETGGKLGFFILRDGSESLKNIGAMDAQGNLQPGFSFNVVANGADGYRIVYTGPDGQTHDLMYRDGVQMMEPAFGGDFLGQVVQGVAGRNDDDAGNVLRYGFEDQNIKLGNSDLDFNDVQIRVEVQPTSTTINVPVSGNVLLNDVVGQDDLSPVANVTTNGTKVIAVAFENDLATPFSNVTNVDAGGKFMIIEGEYGTLKIYENGAYTYVYDKAKTTGDLTEVFHYTIIDNDGDTDTANLVITVGSNYTANISTSAASLNEANLLNSLSDDSTTKDITIVSKDGINSIALSTTGLPALQALGQNVTYSLSADGKTLTATAAGQTIFTVVLNAVTGDAASSYHTSYTFNLVHPLDNPGNGQNITDIPVKLVVTDGNGDVTNGTLALHVVDDVPVAQNDAFGLGVNPSIGGNILSNDNFGADGKGALASVTFNGQTKDVPANGSVSFDGPNGENLTVNANGDFTYNKPNQFGPVNIGFDYTIKDHDGDASQAHVSITGNDNPVIIVTPPPPTVPGTINPAADPAVLNEHDLTQAPNPDSVQHTITFTAQDGFSDIKIIPDGLPNLTSNGQPVVYTVSPDGNTLTGTAGGTTVLTVVIGEPTGNNGSYTVPYTFTLNQPLDNPGQGTNTTDIPVQFVVTDTDGDTGTSTLPLKIVDDVPVAQNDTYGLGTGTSVNGNILANDAFGADGQANPPLTSVTFNGQTQNVPANGAVTFTGANGETLTVHANGDFSYNKPNSFGQVSTGFTYTIQDHDGDTSSANVSITGSDNPVIITTPDPRDPNGTGANAPGVVVDEHNLLPLGQATTSTTNVINFTAPDGFASMTLKTDGLPQLASNGQPVTYQISQDGHTLFGSAGGMTVFTVSVQNPTQNPDGSYQAVYQFTLVQALTHPGDGKNITNIPVQFSVSDTDGDSATSTLPLKVIDDVPVANNDALVLGTASTGNGTNLLNNDMFNADGVTGGIKVVNNVTYHGATKDFGTPTGVENGIKFVSFTDASGTLKVFENGEYSFSRPASVGTVNENFSYTIKDFDGDIASANVTISGSNNPVIIITPDPNGGAPGVALNEHDLLPLGQTTTTTTNIITFTAPDGFANLSLKTDGLPQLASNGQPVSYQLSQDGHTLYGSVNGSTVFMVSVQNPVQQADGSYQAVYQFTLVQSLTNPGAGTNVTDIPVHFTVSDSDGSTASSTLPLKVIDDVPVAANDSLSLGTNLSGNGSNILANDAFNADGPRGGVPGHVDNITFAGTTKNFATPDGIENGVKFVTISNGDGTLKVFENGEYSFVRASANGTLNQSFSYTISDSDGDSTSATVTITGQRENNLVTILTPAVDPSGATIPEHDLLDNVSDIKNNQVAFTAPDGVGHVALSLEGLPILTSHGQTVTYSLAADGSQMAGTINNGQTLVFNVVLTGTQQQPDGSYRTSYSFNLLQPLDNPGTGQNVTDIPLKFTVVDTDGDQASTQLPLKVIDDVPSITSAAREVDETSGVGQTDFNIVNGNLIISYGADGPADSGRFTMTGLNIDGATQQNHLTSGGALVSVALENNTYVGTANGQTVFTLTVDAEGNYAFHQYKPLDHNNPNDPNETINFNVTYNVKDHDGDTAAGQVTIQVHDDAPVANADSNSLTVETKVFNVLGGAPDFPSLLEHAHVPENQPALYQMGADKASNVVIDHPTTIEIERIPLNMFTSISGSPVFAVTQKDDGSITNIKLIFGNGSTDSKYDDTPTHATYEMTENGKLGFFIIRGGTFGLEHIGAIDDHGVIQPGYTFGLEPFGNAYKVTYTGPDGQTHDVPVYDYQDNFESATAGAAFAGHGFAPYDNDHGYVQGLAGRQDGDAENVLRYGFEDGPLFWDGNDLDYNDVQFKITINPTYVQVSPPISGNVLPNDRVGLDVINGRSYETMVTQVAIGMGAFVSVMDSMQSDANGKYVDIQGQYGVLRMHENGEYTYTFNATGTGGDLTDDFRYVIRDFDGDSSNAATLTIHINDNGQVNSSSFAAFSAHDASDASAMALVSTEPHTFGLTAAAPADTHAPDAAPMAFAKVAAAHAPDGIAPHGSVNPEAGEPHGNILYDENGNPIAMTQGIHLDPAHSAAGDIPAAGNDHFALDNHFDGVLTSNGQAIETTLVDGTLHGSVNGQDVFTLSLSDNGHYQFDVQGPIDQAQDGTTLSFGYTAKDGDGSAVEGQFMIDVAKAGPSAGNDPALPDHLALHDLVGGADAAPHADVAINTVSNADIINSILDNHDPANGYGTHG